MTITDKTAAIFDQKARLVSQQMTTLFPVCHWAIYKGQIIFLIGTPDPSPERFRADKRYGILEYSFPGSRFFPLAAAISLTVTS